MAITGTVLTATNGFVVEDTGSVSIGAGSRLDGVLSTVEAGGRLSLGIGIRGSGVTMVNGASVVGDGAIRIAGPVRGESSSPTVIGASSSTTSRVTIANTAELIGTLTFGAVANVTSTAGSSAAVVRAGAAVVFAKRLSFGPTPQSQAVELKVEAGATARVPSGATVTLPQFLGRISGEGALRIVSGAAVDVQPTSRLELVGNTEIEAGSSVTIGSQAQLVLGSGSCVAASQSGASKATLSLTASSLLEIDGAFVLDGTHCAVSRSAGGTAGTNNIFFRGRAGSSGAAVVRNGAISAALWPRVRFAGAGAVRLEQGSAFAGADLVAQESCELVVATALEASNVFAVGSATVAVGAGGSLSVPVGSLVVARGATLRVDSGSSINVRRVRCGDAEFAESGTATVSLGAGATLTVAARFDVDGALCKVTGATNSVLSLAGTGTGADAGATSVLSAGADVAVGQLRVGGQAVVRTSTGAEAPRVRGAVALVGSAQLRVDGSLRVDGALTVGAGTNLHSSGVGTINCTTVSLASGSTFNVALGRSAAQTLIVRASGAATLGGTLVRTYFFKSLSVFESFLLLFVVFF